jgi:tetratricopeptide (TPR) repeat protein
MKHRHVKEYLLQEYVEGTITADEAEQVRKHLESCAPCRAEEKEIRSLLAEIQALPSSIPEGDLWSAIALELGVAPEGEQDRSAEDVSDRFLETLAEMIALRHMNSSKELIEDHFDRIVGLGPGTKNAAPLLGYFARWLQMGFANQQVVESPYIDLLKQALNRFPRAPRPSLSVREVAHLQMVEGFLLLHATQYEQAIRRFQFVISLDVELGDRDQIATAYFSIAKAYRRQGAYNKALHYANLAIDVARTANRVEMAAGFSVMLGWLLLQQGESKQAKEVLCKANKALQDSDDYLRLGNIQSAFGRIVQRDGKYSQALDYFYQALHLFRTWRVDHSNVARTLVNIAFIKTLMAQRAEGKRNLATSDGDSMTPRRVAIPSLHVAGSSAIERWRSEAEDHLREADRIYRRQQNIRGLGSVQLTYSMLYLSQQDTEGAASAATTAYELGIGKADHILMARARILSSMVEIVLCERETDDSERPGSHAERARTFSEDAIEHASQTENRRLVSRGQIWLAIAYLHESPDDIQRAETLLSEAMSGLKAVSGDYVSDDMQSLQRLLARVRGEKSPVVITA